MQIYLDYEGNAIRLTDERLYGHIAPLHPRVMQIDNAIPQTLASPEVIQIDADDDEARLYYKRLERTWVVVVVAFKHNDAFVITAYTMKRNPRNWQGE